MQSMTGFASRRAEAEGASWHWEMRSVNGKGLDLRLRLPEGIDGLEPLLRAEIGKVIARGNVALSLRMSQATGGTQLHPDREAVEACLAAIKLVESAAAARGLTLRPSSAVEILLQRGVMGADAGVMDEAQTAALRAALMADLQILLAEFSEMRAREGKALLRILSAQLDQVADLTAQARAAAGERQQAIMQGLREAIARMSDSGDLVDEARFTQELALVSVRLDVTEELDRLEAHIAAART
ncbi:YicC family protein, partial [Thioclava sp. BHET1]